MECFDLVRYVVGGGGFYQYLYIIGTCGTKIDVPSVLTFMSKIAKGVGKYIYTYKNCVSFIDIDMMWVGEIRRRGIREEPFNDNISDVDYFSRLCPMKRDHTEFGTLHTIEKHC